MALLYDRVLRHRQIKVNKSDTTWNWSFNMPCKSLKGILVLFEEEGPYARVTSKFYNPKIQKVSVIVEGKPNQLFGQGMRSFEQYDEIRRYFAEGKKKDKNIRRQAKMLYVWYPKNRTDLNTIHEENDIIETPEELANVKKQLKQGKHTCLIMRMEHPRAYKIR